MNKNYFIRLGLSCLGGIVLGIGVTFFVKAAIGLDPMNMFADGIAKTFNITFGQASLVHTGLQVLLALAIARKNVNIGTIISAVIISPVIDLVLPQLYNIMGPENTMLQTIMLFVLYQLFISVAVSLIVGARVGFALLDAVIYRIMDWTHKDYKVVKMGIDFLYVIVALILGGSFGFGTIIVALVSGPVTGFMIGFTQKHVFSKLNIYDDNKSEAIA